MMNQISFAKLETGMDMTHLLDIQTRAFESLLQLDAASQLHAPVHIAKFGQRLRCERRIDAHVFCGGNCRQRIELVVLPAQ